MSRSVIISLRRLTIQEVTAVPLMSATRRHLSVAMVAEIGGRGIRII